QQRVDHAEDRRVGSDAKPKRDHGDDCESRRAAYQPEPVPQILDDRLQGSIDPYISRFLLQNGSVPEAAEGLTARLALGHSGGPIFPRHHLDVESHLLRDLLVKFLPTEKEQHAAQQFTQFSHLSLRSIDQPSSSPAATARVYAPSSGSLQIRVFHRQSM